MDKLPISMFFITDDLVVHPGPMKNYKDHRITSFPLTGKTVLHVTLGYETNDRKPYKFQYLSFDRITFDTNGVYDVRSKVFSKEKSVTLQYATIDTFGAGGHNGEKLDPLPMPQAPVLPNQEELKLLKQHLNRKYPLLLLNDKTYIERIIHYHKAIHIENIEKMKQSYL